MGRSFRRRTRGVALAAILASVVALPGAAVAATGGGSNGRSEAAAAGVGAMPASCNKATGPEVARCYLSLETTSESPMASPATKAANLCKPNATKGWTACNIESMYGVKAASGTDGAGNVIAVVDPYHDPNAGADLSTYRADNDLPACTTANGCFEQVNQDGVEGNYPSTGTGNGWASEEALDTQMVSAICPLCHILLVEANSNGFGDLTEAENEAATLGARVISNSWGTGEFNGETGYDSAFDHPGVDITFSSGDGSYQGGVQYPSASPYVTSVGGTQLKVVTTNARGWKETAWVSKGSTPPTQGSGSGCSAYEPKPAWQSDPGCTNRMTADVSAVAADVKVYDTYEEPGWLYGFGTSVSSPIIAGMYGLADNQPTYTVAASAAYNAPSSDFFDIKKGTEGACTPTYFCVAVLGYDGPTGLGSPDGFGAFEVPVTSGPTISSVKFTGSSPDPTVTIDGSNLGSEPSGTPAGCGTTGDNFSGNSLTFSDNTGSWEAGTGGDCIGLVVASYSSSQVVYSFGSGYATYGVANSGDSYTLTVQGVSFSGSVSYPS